MVNNQCVFPCRFFPQTVLDVTSRTSRRKPDVRSCESPRDIRWKLWRGREAQDPVTVEVQFRDGEAAAETAPRVRSGRPWKRETLGDAGGCWRCLFSCYEESLRLWSGCHLDCTKRNLTSDYSVKTFSSMVTCLVMSDNPQLTQGYKEKKYVNIFLNCQ